ncbi:energy transducer TonB [Winogradskyella endarachnes]|uniref:TonB C-terminal domain-containing protein n=1 Tax=Winogradskyella endarachnes TaxID=2681965 RepID=A0A6L6U9T2_9FLAO|nr:hypothetical protein [Winogradskyella endarachnes]MUU77687.1 hypothetical protein [Winogradskyella endarachnes]
MKKRIIISTTALAILAIVLFGFTNLKLNESKETATTEPIEPLIENNAFFGPYEKPLPNLYYGVDTRFKAVKKSDIDKATSIYDFITKEEKEQIIDIKYINLIVIENNEHSNTQESGKTAAFTETQLQILKATDYFSHFTVKSEFKGKNPKTRNIEDMFISPHITVVPNQQAQYVAGKEALVNYFKDHSRRAMSIITDNKIYPIKISFIINKKGKVTDVKHDAMSTGYPEIDAKLMELVKNIPGQWIPAQKANGEKTNQELVFTFGPDDGC